MRRIFHLTVLFAALLCGIAASAQRFVASARPEAVQAGEDFTVTYSISGSGSHFRPPAFHDVDVLSGPDVSNSFNMVNGSFSQSSSYSFTLRARHKGTLIIPPAAITANGHEITSNTLKIEVSGAGQQAQGSSPGSGDSKPDGNVFLRASINKKAPIEGEAVVVSYKLYVHNVNINEMIQTKMPSFPGFWVENVQLSKQAPFSIENYKGKDYRVYVVKKSILFPQKAGPLTIDPLEIECTGEREVARKPDPNNMFPDFPFDDFFHDVEPFHITLKSDALSLNVSQLPANGKPASFSGFVGQGAISANVTPKQVKQNEPITYRITIGGEGPLTLMQPFKLNLPADIQAYDPKTLDKIDRGGSNLSGTRTFEYTLIPRKQGSFTLPAVPFSYYDPLRRKYVESQTPPFNIIVEKGENTGTASTQNGRPSAGTVLHYLDVIRKWSWIAIAPIALALLIMLIARKNKTAPAEDHRAAEKNPEPPALTYNDYLKEAAAHIGQPTFYTEILTAMYAFLNERFGMAPGNISREHIREVMQRNGIENTTGNAFLSLIERCEFANYAPGASSGFSQENMLEEVKRLLLEMGA